MSTNAQAPRAGRVSAGIIGGGALGLAAGLRLAEAGWQVAIFEQEKQLGGLAAGFSPVPRGGATLEKFYHHIFRTDKAAIRLIAELGLADRLLWGNPLTAALSGGKVYPMTPAGLLRFSPISVPNRLRLAAALAALKLTPSEQPFSGSTAAAWSRRWAGAGAYDALLGPLLAGKFGARAPDIAMSWLWSRFHERSIALGYLRGGFQQLYDRLGERIASLGGTIHLGVRVESIEAAGDGVTVRAGGAQYSFDRLLVTVPERVFLRLAPGLPAGYAEHYPGPDFYSAHVLVLALDRPLTSVYWLNMADPGYPFLVLVEHTNFLPAEDYGGRHLVYLGNYLPPDAPLFRQSEEEVLRIFLPALERLNPGFELSWVQDRWIFQAPYAQPIVTRGYLDRLPPHQTPLPGVYFASMAHVYPQDRGQNYSILLGERMGALMLANG